MPKLYVFVVDVIFFVAGVYFTKKKRKKEIFHLWIINKKSARITIHDNLFTCIEPCRSNDFYASERYAILRSLIIIIIRTPQYTKIGLFRLRRWWREKPKKKNTKKKKRGWTGLPNQFINKPNNIFSTEWAISTVEANETKYNAFGTITKWHTLSSVHAMAFDICHECFGIE